MRRAFIRSDFVTWVRVNKEMHSNVLLTLFIHPVDIMPLPRTMPPSPGRTRCKLPVLVSASNLPKVIVLDEEVKRAVNTSLERFHCSKQRGILFQINVYTNWMFTFAHFSYDLNVLLSSEMEFPSSLLSTERAYIHRLVETWGYMSKSKGYEYCFMFLLVLSRDAPNFRPNLWPKTHFSVFGRNAFITETSRPKQKFVMTQPKSAASTRLSG